MAEHQVLFCPFCRESFERETHCPEHELPLVRFDRLAPDPAVIDDDLDEDATLERDGPAGDRDDHALGMFALAYGRGWVGLGALTNLGVLALPVFAHGRALPVYVLARMVPSLWTPLLVSFTALFVLARRRTARSLRGLRLLVPLLAVLSPLTLASALVRFADRVADNDMTPGGALYVALVSSALLAFGGLRLGGASTRA